MTQAIFISEPLGGHVVRLEDRAVIRLAGPDWRSFLQGLVTQDVETIASGEVRYGALLTPQGRLLYDLFIWADEAGARLDVDAVGRESLMARLAMYRLRAKVEITPGEQAVWALTPGGGRRVAGGSTTPCAGLARPGGHAAHRRGGARLQRRL